MKIDLKHQSPLGRTTCVTGYVIDNNLLSRLSSETKISNINIHIDCSDALFITNYDSECEAIFERRDSNSQTVNIIYKIATGVSILSDIIELAADTVASTWFLIVLLAFYQIYLLRTKIFHVVQLTRSWLFGASGGIHGYYMYLK